jgi:hypothetical protein
VPGPSTPLTPRYFLFFVAMVIIGGVAGNLWRQWDTERVKTNKAISRPSLTPQPTPTPAPTPGPARSWKEYLANNPPAPRAELVKSAPRAELIKLPTPRAQLVRDLPPLIAGRQYRATMPYLALEVLATYKGRLGSENMLPRSGNTLGDTWVVGETPWVWIWAPGAHQAGWIDP